MSSVPEKPDSKFDIWWNSPPMKKKIGASFSIGATVVIVGAMFKILHLPGASMMLGFGMTIEAILFMLGVLDKPHKEYHWEKVFDFDAAHPMSGGMPGAATPHLPPATAGVSHDTVAVTHSAGIGAAGAAVATPAPPAPQAAVVAAPAVEPAPQAAVNHHSNSVGVNFTEAISDEDVKLLSAGIKNLTNTAKQISSITNVAAASEKFTKEIDDASLATTKYSKSQDALADSASKLSLSYKGIAGSVEVVEKNTKLYATKVEDITKDLNSITTKGIVDGMGVIEKNTKQYALKIEDITKDLSSITTKGIITGIESVEKSSKQYSAKFDEINKNLSSINSIYEIQLKSLQAQSEGLVQQTAQVRLLNDEFTNVLGDVKKIKLATVEVAEETDKFKLNTIKLSKQVADLNQVYGNMLNALS